MDDRMVNYTDLPTRPNEVPVPSDWKEWGFGHREDQSIMPDNPPDINHPPESGEPINGGTSK